MPHEAGRRGGLDGHRLVSDSDGVEHDVVGSMEPEVLEERISHESS